MGPGTFQVGLEFYEVAGPAGLYRIKLKVGHCIRRTLAGYKIVDHSDVVGASPVGAAPTTSSFSTKQLASLDWAKTAARQDEKQLSLGIGAPYIRDFTVCIFWCVCAVNMHTHVNKSVIYTIIYVLFMLFRILYKQFKNTLQCEKHNDHTSCSTWHNHLLSLKWKTRTYMWIDWPRCRNFTYIMTHDLIYQPLSVSLHKAALATKRWYKKRFSNS